MKKRLLLMLSLIVSATSFSQTVGLVGGFQGWTNPTSVLMTTTDNNLYTITAYTFPATGLKFLVDQTWGKDYGSTTNPSGFPNGTGVVTGATNIEVPAGTWTVTFNLTTKEYTFVAAVSANPEIKLLGTASPSGSTMSTTDGISYKLDSVTLATGMGKFTQTASSNIWSDPAFPSGTATLAGNNIVIPGGTYNITFDKSNGKYSFTKTPVSLIGSFNGDGIGGFGADVPMTTTDAITYTLLNVVIPSGLNDMKFRDNNAWGVNYGASNNTPATTGTGVFNSGSNIFVPAGTYDVKFNRSTLVYNFLPAGTLAVNKFENENFSVSPNPTSNNWTITSGKNDITAVKIVDVTGKTVYTSGKATNNATIEASNLAKGMYFANISSATTTEIVKLIKN
jgi:starch-binding outer membrane protein SusE/F